MAQDSEASPAARAVLIGGVVLVLYVLSLGPATRFLELSGEDLPPRWMSIVYYPMRYIAEHCESANQAIQRYADLWRP
jgi:hypothetical protein